MHLGKTKNENPCEFSFVKQCVNLLSSAVNRREVLSVAVGEWIVLTANAVAGV